MPMVKLSITDLRIVRIDQSMSVYRRVWLELRHLRLNEGDKRLKLGNALVGRLPFYPARTTQQPISGVTRGRRGMDRPG